MDKDRIAGSIKQFVGGVKELAGKALGDRKAKRTERPRGQLAKCRMPSAA
jgi:hypothetical protein